MAKKATHLINWQGRSLSSSLQPKRREKEKKNSTLVFNFNKTTLYKQLKRKAH